MTKFKSLLSFLTSKGIITLTGMMITVALIWYAMSPTPQSLVIHLHDVEAAKVQKAKNDALIIEYMKKPNTQKNADFINSKIKENNDLRFHSFPLPLPSPTSVLIYFGICALLTLLWHLIPTKPQNKPNIKQNLSKSLRYQRENAALIRENARLKSIINKAKR